VKLGLENKKQTTWAIVLGVIAVLAVGYEFIPMFMGGPEAAPTSSALASMPSAPRVSTRTGGKAAKKIHVENLDPTLRLDLLAASEKTIYEGAGRNIFVSQPDVPIPTPGASAVTDQKKQETTYAPPPTPQAPPIPLKFFGFASRTGEPKKIFLSEGADVFVAAEGEIVNRRYKVVRISPTSVEMQDMVYSGPTQNLPLTQG
jgi:hypothetical protein